MDILNEKAWSTYSFKDQRGEARFEEFLKDMDKIGYEVDPAFLKLVREKGTKESFGRHKNFANDELRHLVHMKGNPNNYLDTTKQEREVRGSRKMSTAAKELCFLVAVQLIQELKFDDLTKMQHSFMEWGDGLVGKINEIKQAKPQAIKYKDEMLNDPKGVNEQIETAWKFLDVFGDVTSFEMHHNSAETNKLRKLGAELAGVSEDKWNPADVYFIKGSISNLLRCKDIVTLNAMFSQMIDERLIIPVSLKASVKAATGSLGFSGLSSHALETPKKWDPKRTEDLIKSMNQVNKELTGCEGAVASFSNKRSIQSTRAGEFKTVSQVLTDESFVNEINSKVNESWHKVYPPVVNLLAKMDNLQETLENAILTALSLNPNSAVYFKATPAGVVRMGETKARVNLDLVEFAINTVSVLLHYVLDHDNEKKHCTAQIRSKGSKPQIITYDTTRGRYSTVLTFR